MSKPSFESAHEPLDLRWTFVPMTVVLGALAVVLIWPVGESMPAGFSSSPESTQAAASLPGALAPAAAPQDERAAVQGAAPAVEAQEDDHAPTF
jgi:hypothetical protein